MSEALELPQLQIKTVTHLAQLLDPLNELLIDAVEHAALVGFLSPLSEVDASNHWAQVNTRLQDKSSLMWVALHRNRLVGSLLFHLCDRADGRHRADMQHLLVHSRVKRQGIGSQLLRVAEQRLLLQRKQLLMLCCEAESAADKFFSQCHYQKVGLVPAHFRQSNGHFGAAAYFYKKLAQGGSE